MKWKKRTIVSWTILVILAVYALLPIYLLFLNSFKTRGEIFSNPFEFPKNFSFSNYIKVWRSIDLIHGLLNSSMLAILSTIFTLFLGGMAAYVLSKRSRGSSYAMTFLLFCNTLPLFIMLIPLFVWFRHLKLDNLLGVIIVTTGLSLPFSIMLLRSFLVTIPRELEEAALIDGANRWQIFWKVILPVARSGFITVGLLNFIGGWNSFTIPLTFLADPNQQTAIIKIYTLSGQYTAPWGKIFAAIVITISPLIVVFLSLQRYFVKGLIGGALK